MKYRKDIQILRGISVLLVVLFHLEIGRFSSGFLGVDVFFVISGFLMAVLYDSAQTLDFFIKRAKRLLPAYFVVIFTTLAICMLLTTPNDYGPVIKQSLFAMIFSSNIGYWLENSYFSKAAFNPLLHLWSLGVEIQFYLLIPILHWMFFRFRASYFILLLASLTACFVLLGISPKTSFFMMPLRLWEFLIGYGVAIQVSQPSAQRNQALSWLGAVCLILLIGIPMMSVNGDALGFMHGHPGIYALVVALATGTILAVGLPQKIENLRISALLETLGKYSYSIYLVHFPVIVLFLYQPFSGTILQTSSPEQKFSLVAIISLLAYLMYHLIETPLRSHKRTPQWLLQSGFAVLILCPTGLMLQKLQFPENEMVIYQALTDRATYRCGKINRLMAPSARSCQITKTLDKPKYRILLVGNSHADSIKTTFASVAQSNKVSVYFMVENNPLMPGGISAQGIINEAKLRNAGVIVLHYSLGAIKASTVLKFAALAEKNGMTVSFIMPLPKWRENVPKALWENLKQHKPLPTMTLEEYRNNTHLLNDPLSKIHPNNFRIYYPADFFCNDACQLVNSSGKPLYFDDGHLTLTGSELLRGLFGQVISDASQG